MDFFTIANEIAMRASDSGEGKAIVLLHGYLETMDVWENFASELSKKYRVITLDLPGHGISQYKQNATTIPFMADCVKSILEKQNIKNCMIVGHSMGGYVALAFAKKYSDTTNALCLLSSTPFADSEEKKKNREREIELVRNDKLDLLLRINIPRAFADMNVKKFDEEIFSIQDTCKIMETEGIVASIEAMRNREDMCDFLTTIQEKTLLIFGKYDNYIPEETAKQLIEKYPKATSYILENSGHNCFMEEPEKALSIISDFAEKHII